METPEEVRVLLVDDSKSVLTLLSYLLAPLYLLKEAKDGREALKFVDSFNPDVIILDMNMPMVSGLDVMRHIREVAQDHDVQIIVLTAQDTKTLKAQAFAAGANDFLAKPFDREELLSRVGAAARQVSLTRRLRQTHDRLSAEIDLVASLQKRLLPNCSPLTGGVAVDCFYRPSGRASGDYYDYFTLQDGTLRVVMADVSGHGARAAFLMAVVRTLLRVSQTHYLPLAETFSLVNAHLLSTVGEEPDFVSIVAADIDLARASMTVINAGHCPALLHQGTSVQVLEPTHPVLGFFPLEFSPVTYALEKPAGLFLYTDGWYEWRTMDQEVYGLERFQKLASDLLNAGRFTLGSLLDGLEGDAGITPVFLDDVTAMWVRLEAAGTRIFRSLSTPGNSRRLAREAVAAIAEQVADADTLHDLDIILTEACANVSRHAYDQEGGQMEVRLAIDPGKSVDIEVGDWGKGFEGGLRAENPGPDSECGRGMFIICRLSDSCELKHDNGRNIVHVVKHIRKDLWKT